MRTVIVRGLLWYCRIAISIGGWPGVDARELVVGVRDDLLRA